MMSDKIMFSLPMSILFCVYTVHGNDKVSISAHDSGVCGSKLGKAKDVLSNVLPSLNNLSGLLSDEATINNQRPAFYAILSKDFVLGSHQTVIFDNVVTNDGNVYNQHTGTFTAPVDGVYYFATSFVSKDGPLSVQIIKNSEIIGHGLAYPANGSSGSMNVVIHLKRGDNVYLKNAEIFVRGLNQYRSTFAGYLL